MAALVLTAALGGCHRKAEAPKPPPPAAPFSYNSKTDIAEVSLTFPRRLAAYPALHKLLYERGHTELTEFLKQAVSDRAHTDAKGQTLNALYERSDTWRIVADTGRLVSLVDDQHVYAGGAHPNDSTVGLTWDKASEIKAPVTTFFKPTTDYARLDAVLCERVREAKVARLGAEALKGEFWTCPQWKTSQVVLTPSTIAGKVAGLTFLYDPYIIGAYAEGSYAVTVPLAAFKNDLSDIYAPQFAGDPLPLPARKPPGAR